MSCFYSPVSHKDKGDLPVTAIVMSRRREEAKGTNITFRQLHTHGGEEGVLQRAVSHHADLRDGKREMGHMGGGVRGGR